MVFEAVKCPTCGGVEIQRHGQSSTGKKRYICRNSNCTRKTFIRDYTYQGYRPEVK
jgi:transposase-like protein